MSLRPVNCVLLAALGLIAVASGCWRSAERQLVVYTALDRDFSEPIFKGFTEKTGIHVLPKYDTESTKTVGLVQAIIAEASRPRCDVLWNNEILNTLRLEELGLLDAYPSPRADDFPAEFRSPGGTWYGFAARARVLLVNTKAVSSENVPGSIHDLVDPKWVGKVGVAKPLFGTTATHAAVLFAVWGDAESRDYFRHLRANAQILAGNRHVAEAVARGQLAFGLTDTDDAMIELEKGFPVKIVYPDQHDDGMGTLFIPNTVALIKGRPHQEAAHRLIDYLLSSEVEAQLAQGRSAQIPLSRRVTVTPRVQTPQTVKALEVDFAVAAAKWNTVAAFLRDEFASVR